MPRLSTESYRQHRTVLVWAWEHNALAFDALPTWQQRLLHDYFAPSDSLSDVEAQRYRREATQRSPGLPSQAGRAYARFKPAFDLRYLELTRPVTPSIGGHPATRIISSQRVVRVYPVAQPHLDASRLAHLLVGLAVEDARDGGKLSALLEEHKQRKHRKHRKH